jgi:transcriptional regulator with XRE-family HTH domain
MVVVQVFVICVNYLYVVVNTVVMVSKSKKKADDLIPMALELHKAGWTYEKIAERLGVSKTMAYYYVKLGILKEKEKELEEKERLLNEKERQLKELESELSGFKRMLDILNSEGITSKDITPELAELMERVLNIVRSDILLYSPEKESDLRELYNFAIWLFGEKRFNALCVYRSEVIGKWGRLKKHLSVHKSTKKINPLRFIIS